MAMNKTNEYTVSRPHKWEKKLCSVCIWDNFKWSKRSNEDNLATWVLERLSTNGRRSKNEVPTALSDFVYVSFTVYVTKEIIHRLFRKPLVKWHVTMEKYAESKHSYPGSGTKYMHGSSAGTFHFEYTTEVSAVNAFRKADVLIEKIERYLNKLDQDKNLWLKLCKVLAKEKQAPLKKAKQNTEVTLSETKKIEEENQ